MDALVDANVWLPIIVHRHEHHRAASAWWDAAPSGSATWCRAIQMAVLRLLTNTAVMSGDVLTPEAAWDLWERLRLDDRTAFLTVEPPGADTLWQKNIRGRTPTPKLWTDAYLAALAESACLTFVTFDRGFRSFSLTGLRLLNP